MDETVRDGRGNGGRGALGWAALLVVMVVAAAALIAGAIRGGLGPSDASGARPTLSGPPSPAPAPLPRPGPAPRGTLAAGL